MRAHLRQVLAGLTGLSQSSPHGLGHLLLVWSRRILLCLLLSHFVGHEVVNDGLQLDFGELLSLVFRVLWRLGQARIYILLA